MKQTDQSKWSEMNATVKYAKNSIEIQWIEMHGKTVETLKSAKLIRHFNTDTHTPVHQYAEQTTPNSNWTKAIENQVKSHQQRGQECNYNGSITESSSKSYRDTWKMYVTNAMSISKFFAHSTNEESGKWFKNCNIMNVLSVKWENKENRNSFHKFFFRAYFCMFSFSWKFCCFFFKFSNYCVMNG